VFRPNPCPGTEIFATAHANNEDSHGMALTCEPHWFVVSGAMDWFAQSCELLVGRRRALVCACRHLALVSAP
jgi:hypothetical protein